VFDDDVARDGHNYAADPEVVARLEPAVRRGADLVVGHLNEPDTAAHMHGPDSEAALDNYRSTDAHLGTVIDAMRATWDDTVLFVVSDHDLETTSDEPPIDLYEPMKALGVDLVAIPEGNGATVWGDDPLDGTWLDAIPGVAGHAAAWSGARVVWADPGRWFGLPPGFGDYHEAGHHGGSTTRNQIAVVAGGHPAARRIAAAITSAPPTAADWAPTMAALLDVQLPDATGRNLTT
jgi:arylsulfatase A-like enzyme